MTTDYSSKVSQFVTALWCTEINPDPTYYKSLQYEKILNIGLFFNFITSDKANVYGYYIVSGEIISYKVNSTQQPVIYPFSPDCFDKNSKSIVLS